ncbi:MAG: hypothetical protein ACJ72I_19755 [Pseudonocardiaceae bacterium]
MAASVARHNPTEAVRVSDPMAIAGRVPTVVLNSDRTAVNIMTRFTKIVLIQAWGAASMPVTGIRGSSRSWVPGGLIYGQPSTANTELVRAAAHRYRLYLNATNHVAWWGGTAEALAWQQGVPTHVSGWNATAPPRHHPAAVVRGRAGRPHRHRWCPGRDAG